MGFACRPARRSIRTSLGPFRGLDIYENKKTTVDTPESEGSTLCGVYFVFLSAGCINYWPRFCPVVIGNCEISSRSSLASRKLGDYPSTFEVYVSVRACLRSRVWSVCVFKGETGVKSGFNLLGQQSFLGGSLPEINSRSRTTALAPILQRLASLAPPAARETRQRSLPLLEHGIKEGTMASAGGLRAITPAEPSAAFAPVDIDDDETSSEAVPSHHSLGEQSDNAGVDNGPGCSKYCSLTSSGVTQQLGPGGAAGEDTSLAQLGRSRGIVDYRENHSVETSGASKMGSAGGPGKAGSTADSHASTGTSSKPYRKTAGNGQRCGREYRAADSISEGTTPVESPPPTGRGKGVVADEGWGMVAGGPEQRSASTAAVVPCPPDACAAHQQHHHSAAVDRGENKGVSAAAVTVESNVCGWEPRRPLSGKKHLASAGAPVYTAGESPRDRYPSSAPALKPWSDALVEGEKLPPEVQAHVAVQTRDVSATTSAEVELPSATTTSSTSASTLCLQRSPPERTHGDGDVEHEREEQRSGGNGGDGGGVVADHHTTRPRSWELDFQQRRREVMITDAAIGGEGWRRQEHETRRSSEESARVAKHKEVNGEEHEDGRMRSPPAAENAEVVPPASCASGEDTDDEPLWAAAWKAPKRSRDLRGERDPATRVQSDRWTELKVSRALQLSGSGCC